MDYRKRVLQALNHEVSDRTPVDFLATPEIWEKLIRHFGITQADTLQGFFDPAWEEVLRMLDVDCRVVSYDQFCKPPESLFEADEREEWWDVMGRSTPARMWRRVKDGEYARCIFGRLFKRVANETGVYESNVDVLADASCVDDLKQHCWPDPDWWDFSALPSVIKEINGENRYHIRYRIGTVFELAWQLRGLDTFFMDLALNPDMVEYMLDRITDILCEVTERALSAGGDLIDMVYFYDDVASNSNLLISKDMWNQFIRPRHEKIIAVAKRYDKSIMYHSDGALRMLLPELIDMGIDVLNPIQPDAAGMALRGLKDDFGDRLCFHGGIDIKETLPKGSVDDVRAEVADRIGILGERGGYIMASSHHIQSDTPLENVLAMYDFEEK
ncbi:uroporphyrinogen decarboxylase family protein [Sediminispirochaeta smaragdinae]|uniref:Uroporphyrinogen-III decarboxylase-like protein n=1 Tax=Sediminispirochaeta smaragdinae (strain DSM 11293 / JCM 15392 / SEBR 4228) TaxID=573413 RepID=E1R2M3_SEDSS|nr:uroporphyrinogen decarboxylase family protein [Sediminispirochaeta smaragdinae]ADK80305.1 uroporphyrinogen-III decarboxylase-like protein [Sediminispirochaeta smaragdinae DSM 11293]